MAKNKVKIGKDGIYDARQLGGGRMVVLGIQHLFAMFGATVTVPLLTGLDVSTTLLFAGLGTLLFHCLTKFKVPAFLGSSFAFLGGYFAIAPMQDGVPNVEKLPYACLGVACAGLLYFILAAVIKIVGVHKVMKLFPPVVTGPIIIAIGLGLAPSAVNNCKNSWALAIIALVLVVAFNIFGRGMIKIVPILLGVVGAYLASVILGNVAHVPGITPVDFTGVKEAAWIGFPINWSSTVFGGVHDKGLAISAIIAIVPIAFATMMEHIGDISAISATVGKNYIDEPGLHRTLLGDGLATVLASLFGAPANTTYGENTGVLALSKVYDPRVVRFAAYFAMFFSFCPKFAALIQSIPAAVVGGISFVLYCMISAIGVRNIVEAKVDFSKARNTIVAALILVIALGLTDGITFTVKGTTITLTALAVASIAGIVINAIFPDKDFKAEDAIESDKNVKTINLDSDYGKKKAEE